MVENKLTYHNFFGILMSEIERELFEMKKAFNRLLKAASKVKFEPRAFLLFLMETTEPQENRDKRDCIDFIQQVSKLIDDQVNSLLAVETKQIDISDKEKQLINDVFSEIKAIDERMQAEYDESQYSELIGQQR